MDPVAFSLGPLEIRWYGIMMATSMLVGAWISSLILRKHGRDGDAIWDGLFFIIIGGIVGARLVYVITNPSMFFGPDANPWDVFAVWKGGLSIHGGIILGLVVTYYYFLNKNIPFIEVMDSFAPGVSLGIILVRIGNFMNGDILGYKWDGPWAMNFPNDHYHNYGSPDMVDLIIPRHPAEFYGILVGLFCLLTTVVLSNETWITKRLPHGSVYLGFVFTYSLVRSVIEEPFRSVPLPIKLVDPATAGFGILTWTQLASIVLIVISLWGFTQLRKWERLRDEAAASGKGRKGLSRQARRAAERDGKR